MVSIHFGKEHRDSEAFMIMIIIAGRNQLHLYIKQQTVPDGL